MHVMFIWVRYIIRDRTIKTWNIWVALPSVTLGKSPICRVPWKYTRQRGTHGKNLCFLGLKWLLCWVSALWHLTKKPTLVCYGPAFAECIKVDTRQRRKLYRVPESLTHGKRRNLCRVSRSWHSTTEEALPSAWNLTHGKMRKLCRVSRIWHSAKDAGLPSVWESTLSKGAVTIFAPSHYLFSPSVGFGSRQSVCWVSDSKHSAKRRLPTL